MNSKLTFLSYARADSKAAIGLVKSLQDNGVDAWIDQLDISIGNRWDEEVQAALRAAEVVIVLLSRASTTSKNVLDEVSYAIDSRKIIMPILLEPCEKPLRLSRHQHIEIGDITSAANQIAARVKEFQQKGAPLPVNPEGEGVRMPATPTHPSRLQSLARPAVVATSVVAIAVLVSFASIQLSDRMRKPDQVITPAPTALAIPAAAAASAGQVDAPSKPAQADLVEQRRSALLAEKEQMAVKLRSLQARLKKASLDEALADALLAAANAKIGHPQFGETSPDFKAEAYRERQTSMANRDTASSLAAKLRIDISRLDNALRKLDTELKTVQ